MARWLATEEFGLFEPVARSLRIEGFSTSVRLERIFWELLDHIAGERGLTTCGLVAEIHREVSASVKPLTNFSSVLRVICLRQLELHGAAIEPAPDGKPANGFRFWSSLAC